jgi:AraC-like DNA-binding protein
MMFRARFIAHIIQFAARQGASRKKLLGITGKSFTELQDDELMLDASIYNQVIEEAADQTGNELLGLHMGSALALSAAGLVVQITQSSRTVEEAILYMVEFNNLGCQSMPFQLTKLDGEWQLSVHPHSVWLSQSPIAVRHTMDGMLMFTLRQFQSLTHQRYQPLRVCLSYPRPVHFEDYEQLFKCPVRFNQPISAIYIDEQQMQMPIATSDYQLLQLLVKYAEQKLQRLEEKAGYANTVGQTILQLSTPHFPVIELVADNLHLSVRSLQRKLKAEGYTFKSLTEQLKQQLALDYLDNKSLTIKEIAYLLDYADASSFIRSFRRWKGLSPEQYRVKNVA